MLIKKPLKHDELRDIFFLKKNKSIHLFVCFSIKDFLVVSFDNIKFIFKYFTIVDGIFYIHKSCLNKQTDHELYFNHCTLSFSQEPRPVFYLMNKLEQDLFVKIIFIIWKDD